MEIAMRILYVTLEDMCYMRGIDLLYGKNLRLNWKHIALIVLDFSLFYGLAYSLLSHLLGIITHFSYPLLQFGFEKRKYIANIQIGIVLLGILQLGCWSILSSVYTLFCRKQLLETYDSWLALNVMAFLIALVCFPHMKLDKFSNFMQQKIVLLQLVLSLGFLGIMEIVYNRWSGRYVSLLLEDYGFLFISLVLIFSVLYMWQKSHYKAKEWEMQLQMHQMYDEGFQNLIEDIRKKQHDFQNHLNAIQSMHYTCTTYEELVKEQQVYVEAIQTENQYYRMLSIGNSVIIGFLYGKFLQAEKQGITVSYDIRIQELQSRVPLHKMVEVIGNLFDNAMEAIENSEKEKVIYLELLEESEKIVLKVKNESDYVSQEQKIKMFERGESSKGTQRGFGLTNVKQICQEYNCDLQVKNQKENGKIYLEFQITIMSKKENKK